MSKGRLIIYTVLSFVLMATVLILLRSLIRTSLILQLLIAVSIGVIITYYIVGRTNTMKIDSNGYDRKKFRFINLGVIVITLLIIAITPFFQSIWFYIRHIMMFILIAFLLCFNGYFIGKKMMTKYPNKATTLKVFTFTMVTVGLFLFSNLQLYYIQNYEIPPLYGCSYYDDYGNIIYNSQIAGSCPTLENVVKTESEAGSKLSFTVREEIFRYDDDLIENYIVNQKYTYDSQVEYQYDRLNRVTKYEINLIISGYSFDENLQDYKLFRKVNYHKNIENRYEDNKIISTHKIVNTDTLSDSLSYDYDVTYISELMPRTDKDLYFIEVSKITNDNSEVKTDLLYTIDVSLHDNEYTYVIRKGDKKEYLVLSVEERTGWTNEYIIRKDFYVSIYNRIRTEKEQNFNFHQSLSHSNQKIFINDFTRYEPYIGTEVDFNNDLILTTHEDGLFNQSFFNFTNMIEKTDYGFKINHYHMQRENDFSYNTYNKTIEYSIDYPNNHLSIELQKLNNYEYSLYYPDYYTFELVYQDNPLLMRNYIEALMG